MTIELNGFVVAQVLDLGFVWRQMKVRCAPEAVYGRRGITVCKAWSNDPAPFILWALTNGYEKGLQIDRKNNDRGYTPANCRWVTPKVNNRNKRSSVFLTAFGERKTIADWADDPRCIVPYSALYYRIRTCGWETKRALTTPSGEGIRTTSVMIEAFGETKTLTQWSQDPRCVVPLACLGHRMAAGYEPVLALTTKSGSIRPQLSAFGKSQSLLAWSKDPRCLVKYGVLRKRVVEDGINLVAAMTTPNYARLVA